MHIIIKCAHNVQLCVPVYVTQLEDTAMKQNVSVNLGTQEVTVKLVRSETLSVCNVRPLSIVHAFELIDLLPCERQSPCQNRGNCTNNDHGYDCSCPPGYEGTNCQNETDDCLSNPCQSQGTCTVSFLRMLNS